MLTNREAVANKPTATARAGGAGAGGAGPGPEGPPPAPRAAAGESGEGSMGNTPLAIRQTLRMSPISEDTAHLSAWVNWDSEAELFAGLDGLVAIAKEGKLAFDENSAADKYRAKRFEDFDIPLERQQDMFEADDEFETDAREASVTLAGYIWHVTPWGLGANKAKKKQGVYYPYALRCGGVTIAIRRGSKTLPNVWIEMGSIPLAMEGGLANLWKIVAEIIGEMGGKIVNHVISRVDIYTDVVTKIAEAFDRFEQMKFITKARKQGKYLADGEANDTNNANGESPDEDEELGSSMYRVGRRKTGFTIGGGIKLRVYDKVFEMRKQPVKQQVFADRYGGALPEDLMRVEYQLRRSETRDFMVTGERLDTVEEYERNKGYLWKYLTENWFRMTEGEIDRKNRNHARAETWSVWKRIGEHGQTDPDECDENGEVLNVFRVPRVREVDMKQLNAQAVGCATKSAVFGGAEVASGEDIIRHFARAVRAMTPQKIRNLINQYEVEKELTVFEREMYG